MIQENSEEILQRWTVAGGALFSEKTLISPLISDALSGAMAMILEGIDENGEALGDGLESLSRIFAVQPVPPSGAMSLFFELKNIVPETLLKIPGQRAFSDAERTGFQARIDEIILHAFDRYMANREKIYRLKVEESGRRMHMALRRAGA